MTTKNQQKASKLTQMRKAEQEQERIFLQLIEDASAGLKDVAAGNVRDARDALAARKKRRVSENGD